MVNSTILAITHLTEAERLGATVTVIDGPDLGSTVVVDRADGIVAGDGGQWLSEDMLADALAELDVEEEDDADIDGALDEISAAREMLRGGPIDRAALDEALRTIAAELGGEDDQPAMMGEE